MAPEEGDGVSTATANVISRMGERLAALEVRTNALTDDTKRIRDNQHEAANVLQQFIAVVSNDKAVMMQHIADCAKRGARMERLGWMILTGIVGLIFLWIQRHIGLGDL